MASKSATLSPCAAPRPISERAATLAGWLIDHGEVVCAPLTLTRLPGGRTNRTWLVSDSADRRWVLRERESADVRSLGHEASVMSALTERGLPVPRVVGYSGTRTTARFMVSDYVPGITLHSEDDALRLPGPQRRALGVKLVETLAQLHQTDPEAVELPRFRTGHLARRLARMTDLWMVSGSSGMHDSAWRAVRARLVDRRPQREPRAQLVHGDFRLGNAIFGVDVVAAVLDWERCTAGDPLTDLAWLLNNWRGPGEAHGFCGAASRAGGFPSRSELTEVYANLVDISLADLEYHRALAYWTSATLIQAAQNRFRVNSSPPDLVLPDWDAVIADELTSASERLRSYR